MTSNTVGFEGQFIQTDVTAQVYIAFHNKVDFKEVPESIQDISGVPSFIFELGKLKGVLPAHETGYFNGTLKEFENIPDNEKRSVARTMARVLASGNPLWLRVVKINDGIAVLSRKAALASVRKRALDTLKIKDEKELIGKTFKAVVTRVIKSGAYFDLGGIEAFMPRSEINHGFPYPHDVLIAGRPDDTRVNGYDQVKVIDVNDVVIISRKACLVPPTNKYKENSVVKGKVMGFTKNGKYLVVTEDGLSIYAFNPPYLSVPPRQSTVSVRLGKVYPKTASGVIIA